MTQMEQGFGWHYPPGTPAPSTRHVIARCRKCGWQDEGRVIEDLGTADLILGGQDSNWECPHCHQDAPMLRTEPYGDTEQYDFC